MSSRLRWSKKVSVEHMRRIRRKRLDGVADINDFARRLRLKEFFHQNDHTDSTNPSDEVKRFRCKGTWTPPNERDAALDSFINAIENDSMTCKPTPIRNNLS